MWLGSSVAEASSCSSDLTSSLGTYICCRCSPKNAKRKKEREKERRKEGKRRQEIKKGRKKVKKEREKGKERKRNFF